MFFTKMLNEETNEEYQPWYLSKSFKQFQSIRNNTNVLVSFNIYSKKSSLLKLEQLPLTEGDTTYNTSLDNFLVTCGGAS